MMNPNDRVLITGAHGMVGSAVTRLLRDQKFTSLLTPSRGELDLTLRNDVETYFERLRPEYVLMIAAKVGGIGANQADPVGFFEENLAIQTNLLSAACRFGSKKNLFLGSSCIYPKEAPQPMREDYLLTGPLEPTNEAYALAKISGLKLAQYYFTQKGMLTVCPMPCNIYGTGDSFDLQKAHVLSSLVRRFVDAKDAGTDVTLWGTGIALREFIHVDDAARAILFFMNHVEKSEPINVGTGTDISIRNLAEMIAENVGFQGEIHWDDTRPNGMLKKCNDVTRLKALGFSAEISLTQGVSRTVEEYKNLKKQGKIFVAIS